MGRFFFCHDQTMLTPLLRAALLTSLGLGLTACGGGSSGDTSTTTPTPTPTPINTAAANTAAQTVADTDASCTGLGDFYWEIGDTTQALGSGQTGTKSVTASSVMQIASASKMMFSAYVLESKNGAALTQSEMDKLRFISGYIDFNNLGCAQSATIADCYTDAGGSAQPTPAEVGRFYYSGAHDQKLAMDLGLGAYTETDLANAYNQTLGITGMGFSSPQPAGAGRTNAQTYAQFLRRLAGGQLALSSRLGENAVCTQPGTCATADYSPAAQYQWHYGYGHWVETYDGTNVEAYSSPGAFGFYPWVTADKKYYGLLARQATGSGAAMDSVACGRKIRQAWLAAL